MIVVLYSSARCKSSLYKWGYRMTEKEQVNLKETNTNYSLSVILPAHNEEEAIAGTVHEVVDAIAAWPWIPEYEVIVVNDGSRDSTAAIVETIAAANPCVRVIHHPVNQGYGAAL